MEEKIKTTNNDLSNKSKKKSKRKIDFADFITMFLYCMAPIAIFGLPIIFMTVDWSEAGPLIRDLAIFFGAIVFIVMAVAI